MFYKLSFRQEEEFVRQPETGMGYQIIEARTLGGYDQKKYLVLNSEFIIDLNGYQDEYIKNIIQLGSHKIKESAPVISLGSYSILNEVQYRSRVSERGSVYNIAAIESKVEYSTGLETFVRLSAFENDRRVDKINKCLLPGSFTTTLEDYLLCKALDYEPIERYALPNNELIKWTFHIQPKKDETLQRGMVQPANDKSGGGKEIYFANGTSNGTLLEQSTY